MPIPASDEPQPLAALLPIGSLLTLVGGYLDAYAWVAHGNVFANAQTGNVIFFGLNLATRNWHSAWAHLVPVLAFILGVLVAKLLGVKSIKRTYAATLLCQAVELGTLVALFLPQTHIPHAAFVPCIAFAAALQVTSFGALGPLTFNSAMTTGNLLQAVSGAFAWLHDGDPGGRVRAGVYSWIVCCFAAGAVLGAAVTRDRPGIALLPCIVLLAAAAMLTFRLHLRQVVP